MSSACCAACGASCAAAAASCAACGAAVAAVTAANAATAAAAAAHRKGDVIAPVSTKKRVATMLVGGGLILLAFAVIGWLMVTQR